MFKTIKRTADEAKDFGRDDGRTDEAKEEEPADGIAPLAGELCLALALDDIAHTPERTK